MGTTVREPEDDVLDELRDLSRPEELAWYARRLEIGEAAVLALLGVYTKTAGSNGRLTAVAAARPDATIWVTELFREILSRYRYDVDRLKVALDQPVAEEPRRQNVVTGKTTGGGKPKLSELLDRVQTGGPTVFEDLVQYLRLAKAARPPRKKA